MKELHTSLSGQVRVKVFENSRVVRDLGWQKNLILDQGLDKIASVAFNQLFANCAVGNGTAPTTIHPAATATVAGNVLSASAATFSSADLDSDVRFATGEYFKIQSITDPQHVTLFSTGTVAAPTAFTILRTNEAILSNELKRTPVCSQVPAANEVIDLGGTLLLQRTFLFAPETTTTTYTEVGFSNIGTAGANLFSRILLDTPVVVNAPTGDAPGQQLQVTYQLKVGFDYGQGPGKLFSGSTPTTIAITGLPIHSNISLYADSIQVPGKLSVTIAPPIFSGPGDIVTLAGASVTAYNGNWPVLFVESTSDPTLGPQTIVTLDLAWATAATGGTLATAETGTFFRPCYGIWWITAAGGQGAPPDTPDVYLGYGEPSVPGLAWLANSDASELGGNNVALRPVSAQIANCALSTYTLGSFHIDKTVSFTVEDDNPVSSFGVGNPDQTNQIETWTWDQPQALGARSQLQLVFRFSWSRTTF